MATWRLDLARNYDNSRANQLLKKLSELDLKGRIDDLRILDSYTLLSDESPDCKKDFFANPKFESVLLSKEKLDLDQLRSLLKDFDFDYLIDISFLPGVTDNVAKTAANFVDDAEVFSSQLFLFKGELSEADLQAIAKSLHNPLIQSASIITAQEALELKAPKVKLNSKELYKEVNLDISDSELIELGRKGIDSRGPLALELDYMKAIQKHFKELGRKPSDLELESIAQTWSEHCKHTIFADPIDEIEEGLYKGYIKKATNEIRKIKAKDDFCVSVFSDNAGLIDFDENYLIAHKVETHNSPSALDPFGGAITGIVGVNRDAVGCGLGTKPVANIYGYCFADPNDKEPIYRDADLSNEMLSPKTILEGVVDGVNVGGNCSGIPTVHGFSYFHPRYKGKPLVFVGTLGLVPKELAANKYFPARKSHEKAAAPGDLIVMIGGRVGADGIHGATFSSVEMDDSSPATAVQIGDPITQKKFSDAIVKEARDLGLFRSITDNGAGGLSCSVAEMAQESGGCFVELDKVPLKYPGLEAWQIWISESQERMTLAVPPEAWQEFSELMTRRSVEATVIGEFTDSGKCQVQFADKILMDLELDFLHNGLPKRQLKTKKAKAATYIAAEIKDPKQELWQRLSSLNIASNEYISQQYDHEVQAGSVIKPLQGKNKINGAASVFRPSLDSKAAAIVSSALLPHLTEIDPYKTAALTIDRAIANLIAAGADASKIALLDNFCWCSATDEERLWQLKKTAEACYDFAKIYESPFVSGKDSMFNDFKGYNSKGEAIKISALPTLLISALSVIPDYNLALSIDFKFADDLIYFIGETAESGEAFAPLNAKANLENYKNFYAANQKEIIASAISVNDGLAVSLAKATMASDFGAEVDLAADKSFVETSGGILFTIAPANKNELEALIPSAKLIGQVTDSQELNFKNQFTIAKSEMLKKYKETFNGF